MRGTRAKMLRRIARKASAGGEASARGDRRLYKNLKRTYKIMYRKGIQITGVNNDK